MTIYSKHKNTILDDEYSPFVLAWIEKNGATSEEEIWFDTQIDRAILKNALLKLFDNEFITTFKNYFKISEQGKVILDKLDIAHNLLKLTLDELMLETKEDESELDNSYIILENYRENFYENYLNTQRRLNIWNRITNAKEFKNQSHEFKNTCKKAIISNDILKTYGKASSISPHKIFISYGEEEKKSFKVNSKVIELLNILNSVNSFEQLNKLSICEDDMKFFIEFETINNILPQKKHNDTWFDLYANSKSKDLNERALKSYNHFKKLILNSTESKKTNDFRISLLNYSFDTNATKPLYDTLFILESNNDIDELAKSLSISKVEAESTIQQMEKLIKKYCL